MLKAAALLMLMVAAPATKELPMRHATGTFEVTITPEASDAGGDKALPTARMALHKTFRGDLDGSAVGTMLSIGTPQPGHAASYVALDQLQGTLAGRRGGFVLVHRGSMSDAGQDLSVTVAPGSGTDELAGLTGTLAITQRDGVHHYDLTYTLPPR